MSHVTDGREGRAATILLLVYALSVPMAAPAQSASSDRGGGSSFGRISGGGGSYGRLTQGFTANRPSARIPINALTRANGTANEARRGRTERVPINARTIADGTANTWREPPSDPGRGQEPILGERPTHGPRHGLFRVDGRPLYHYLAGAQAGAAPYVLAPEEDPTEPRRRLGRVPVEPGTTEPDGGEGRKAQGAPMAPRVKPPVPVDEGAEETLSAEECAMVRVTTAGGIQWRQRIRLADYGASTPAEAARALQDVLEQGDPLAIEGPDGSFTVRASLVKSLIVGPCRGL